MTAGWRPVRISGNFVLGEYVRNSCLVVDPATALSFLSEPQHDYGTV